MSPKTVPEAIHRTAVRRAIRRLLFVKGIMREITGERVLSMFWMNCGKG